MSARTTLDRKRDASRMCAVEASDPTYLIRNRKTETLKDKVCKTVIAYEALRVLHDRSMGDLILGLSSTTGDFSTGQVVIIRVGLNQRRLLIRGFNCLLNWNV